ncbi:hypothetical protein THAOC_21461 [Thalassiosira oceanica]|uniref:Uncharacterized protein n=1 Tax=Thalassiosira oceanica TaxID=159749 RepID=K0S0Z2_THAOC|nr:hypothetical protein THAOC_21461 [Thalassiosira oceanica]|eukprot:EJK58414.1 hypothetical protein THAOC_21461 [Thalassiosira oceanica]
MAASAPPSESPSGSEVVGICGADDTANVRHLLSISGEFSSVEWECPPPSRPGGPAAVRHGAVDRRARRRHHGRGGQGGRGRTVRLAAHLELFENRRKITE